MEICAVKASPICYYPRVFLSEGTSTLIVPDCHQRNLCDLILFSYSDILAAVINISDVHFFTFDLSRRSSAPTDFEMLNLIILALSSSQNSKIFFVRFLVYMNNTVDRDSYILFFFVFTQRLQLLFRYFIKSSLKGGRIAKICYGFGRNQRYQIRNFCGIVASKKQQ